VTLPLGVRAALNVGSHASLSFLEAATTAATVAAKKS